MVCRPSSAIELSEWKFWVRIRLGRLLLHEGICSLRNLFLVLVRAIVVEVRTCCAVWDAV